MKDFSIILAVDWLNWIWKDGGLAWDIPEDMAFFKETTTTVKKNHRQNAVIMGRKTWESIPEKFRPLPNRLNCVLSSNYEWGIAEIADNAYGFADFEKCLQFLNKRKDLEQIFITGWSYLYNLVLDDPYLDLIYLTRVHGDFNCDVFFSNIPDDFIEISKSEKKEHNWIEYQFFVYKRKAPITERIKKWMKYVPVSEVRAQKAKQKKEATKNKNK